jgi:DNA-directed RNA polymerase specialized sigma24 family protein
LPSDLATPLESAIQNEAYERYHEALMRQRPKDRELIVARIEMQWSFAEIAHRFGTPSVEAVRMAVTRAMRRLATTLRSPVVPLSP